MRSVRVTALIIAALFAAIAIYAILYKRGPAPPPYVQSIASNLETVWALAFAPDGRLFLTERPGRIRVIQHDQLSPEPWATIPVFESAAYNYEAGLLGLAIDPQFSDNRRVYVCFTERDPQRPLVPKANSIGVLTEQSNGKGSAVTVLLTGIVANFYHDGCRLKFGPDGKLYASTGDAAEGGERSRGYAAQSLPSKNGKILRMNPDGSIPADNPFPNSYVWSYGHRNPQGLAFHPQTGQLFETEQGTGSPGHGNNEVNLIESGKNFGWPRVVGEESHAGYTAPLVVSNDPLAGATFVTSERFPTLRGNLVIGTLGTQRLLSVVFKEGNTNEWLRTDVLIDKTFGRLRDVIEGPDGFLYFSTSNRDGRGPRTGRPDDQVFRLLEVPH
jgi:glucose/arabinose dehydrogenase